jgi:heme exporter protein A
MMYKLTGVSFGYTPDELIFNNLDMEIKEKEIILLTGMNGSGKTTFCRLLTGLIKANQGTIIFGDKDLKTYQTTQIAEKVLYLKQEGSLNVVAATADEDLQIRQFKFKKDMEFTSIKNRENALIQIDMLKQQHIPTWELSAGQVKRIGLASLPLFPSHYWILDEPFLGLDQDSINTVKQWLSERKKQGLGALIINHLANVDDSIFHVHYHLENGKMVKV